LWGKELKKVFTFFDLMTLILFLMSFFGLVLFRVSIFDQSFYFMGFFWFLLLSVRPNTVKRRFSLLQILFFINDWFISKLRFDDDKESHFLFKLAFPISVGLFILSFSGKKGLLYFFGLFLGSIINFLRGQLFTKKV
tara:strand:- start:1319 stop:1729 length:411 start_codon:yes stop_codon:yes gene_type:complete